MRAYTYYSVEYLISSIKYWILTSGYTLWLHISTIDHWNPKPGNRYLMFDTQYHELNIRYSIFNIQYYGREMPQKCNYLTCQITEYRVPRPGTQYSTQHKTCKIVYHDYSDNLYMMIYNFASVSVVLNIEYWVPSAECQSPELNIQHNTKLAKLYIMIRVTICI
jgi:hypothetical protein